MQVSGRCIQVPFYRTFKIPLIMLLSKRPPGGHLQFTELQGASTSTQNDQHSSIVRHKEPIPANADWGKTSDPSQHDTMKYKNTNVPGRSPMQNVRALSPNAEPVIRPPNHPVTSRREEERWSHWAKLVRFSFHEIRSIQAPRCATWVCLHVGGRRRHVSEVEIESSVSSASGSTMETLNSCVLRPF